MLTASDPGLRTWLDSVDPDWEDTQTVPPDSVSVGTITSTTVDLNWTPIPYTGDGGYYEVGYGTSPGTYTHFVQTPDKTASGITVNVNGLTPGTPYYFAVRTFTPAQVSATINLPAPTLKKPGDGSVSKKLPRLQWNKVKGAVTYQIQVDDNSDFSSPETYMTTGKKYTLSGLDYGEYFWRVRAQDGAGGWSAWSEVWSFQYTLLKKPADGSTSTGQPKLQWNKASGALGYELQVDDNAGFSDPVDVPLSAKDNKYQLDGLAPGTYYWRVRVETASGWSAWMPAWQVTITP
jgi:hypothetical protein